MISTLYESTSLGVMILCGSGWEKHDWGGVDGDEQANMVRWTSG